MKKLLSTLINRQALNRAGYELRKVQPKPKLAPVKKKKKKKAAAPALDPLRLDLYKRLYDAATLAKKPFYNIGAGKFRHPYWTNLDFTADNYAHMQKDGGYISYNIAEKKPLPIADGAARLLYTSHTIEHVKEDAVLYLFKEAHRALAPGGIFRVVTGPDAETDYRALRNNDSDWFYWDALCTQNNNYSRDFYAPPDSAPLAERWLSHVASALAPNRRTPSEIKFHEKEILQKLDELGLESALTYFTGLCPFRPDYSQDHVEWWTHGRVIDYLTRAGFKTIYRSGYGQSASPLMRRSSLFDSTYPQISLHVEAVR